MRERRRNLLVGLFVLVGLCILGTLTVLFGQGPTQFLGVAGYPLYVEFESASGIRAGNRVTLGGIEIGRVEAVEFIDTEHFEKGVQVMVMIQREYRIPNGSRAIATEPALGAGRPPIEIIPGPPELGRLQPGSRMPGELKKAIDSIIPDHLMRMVEKTAAQVGDAAESLTPVLKDLHEILVQRTPQEVDRPGGPPGNLSSAMTRLDSSLRHINEVLGEPEVKSRLRQTIDNMHTISEDGKVFVANLRQSSETLDATAGEWRALAADARGTVQRLEADVTSVCREARGMTERGSRLLDTLYGVVSRADRGEGTIGQLVRNAKLYEAMVLTAERLALATEEFRLLVKDWQKGKVRVGF